MRAFDELPDRETIDRAIEALRAHKISAEFVETREQALARFLALLPEGAEVMDNRSATLAAIGAVEEIQNSGRYRPVRDELAKLDPKTQRHEQAQLGSAPRWSVGSCHAVTEEGQLLWASNTGSQLSAYAYAADNVIQVVGAQKIVTDLEQGLRRIYEHSLPLEDQRVRESTGKTSRANKILILNGELPGRPFHVILVNEVLGF
ncbi:MAG: LUD domain-containing protein [Candidatus Geothermincolia bacterium]